ncbi:hypothetical protein MJ923_16545 [Shewanella sp. 3B26]|uniref:Uncharacterized protein n=1 Tax=Shewanella zhuhaiensis TaxID=2919576 RepID=A0AAJ1BJS0_9GAMM|nr:hypothetical protein [Shewanella zhuhaiensis]MCH4295917.1 hypothetical protein [Shewanella zhuhaiensis]
MSINNLISYYQSFETDIENLSRYIEICEDNFQTYSVELTRLYLSICSEVDVALKYLCNLLGACDVNNINDYSRAIKKWCPELIDKKVSLKGCSVYFSPWAELHNADNTTWWREHNDVKHGRIQHYKNASLKNVLTAFCALYTINVFIVFKQSCKQDPMAKFDFASMLYQTKGYFRLAQMKDIPFAYSIGEHSLFI